MKRSVTGGLAGPSFRAGTRIRRFAGFATATLPPLVSGSGVVHRRAARPGARSGRQGTGSAGGHEAEAGVGRPQLARRQGEGVGGVVAQVVGRDVPLADGQHVALEGP